MLIPVYIYYLAVVGYLAGLIKNITEDFHFMLHETYRGK